MLFALVIAPLFLMMVFGAYCSSMRLYKKRLAHDCSNDTNNQFNLVSLRQIKRTENFMIVKSIYAMVGFTIWSLRNIVTIFELFKDDCMVNRRMIDKFWLLNFYIFTLVGYANAIITLIVIPGAALYQCYRVTERQQDTNPY